MPVAIAIHHPKPEFREQWVDVMRHAGAASHAIPGIVGQIEGYREADGKRLLGISRWESLEALQAGIASVKEQSAQADAAWGEQATELLTLSEL